MTGGRARPSSPASLSCLRWRSLSASSCQGSDRRPRRRVPRGHDAGDQGGDDADTDGDRHPEPQSPADTPVATTPIAASTIPVSGRQCCTGEALPAPRRSRVRPAVRPPPVSRGTPLAPSTPSSRVRWATVRVVATATSTTPTRRHRHRDEHDGAADLLGVAQGRRLRADPVGHPEHDHHEERAGCGGDDGQHHLADPPARGQPAVGQTLRIISGPPAVRRVVVATIGAPERGRRRWPSQAGTRRPCLQPEATRSELRSPESPAPQRHPRRAMPTR